ncbi:PDZ domain-containing protein [Halopolyspora algeriensis]|uniref:endopeptidase La n=1 Tax=Halopolyspora algeriensis TaxID=1500506 RepID=A0A368VMW0_9ACTN|nr:PDZ domain-containing protein [Halopolyspora algeriensis]RCW42850.1 PDZ domain-containing protein [Halopolyspora algeriensis]TQM56680.1 PDZ domain-containing protein [Halopolyspora algeriensis]
MSRRTWTLLTSVLLVVAFGLLGAFARVPYVALGPGPTYDTLAAEGGAPVVRINGEKTYPTSGHLNMTTVSVTDRLPLFSALGLWVSGRYALAPREAYFPPGKTEKQIERKNTKAFRHSQTAAETAALRHLGYPMKVVAAEIVEGSPADGVIAPGDRLIAADGEPVTDPPSLSAALKDTRPGDRVRIRFRHPGEPPRTATVRLAERPDGKPQGFLGVSPVARPDVDFTIDISLDDVGGPSAGLMFSLAIVDKLTPGKLTGGRFVAGTGEINGQGRVGPIGGIGFKMVKAREAGATVFLTPAENCATAEPQAPEGLQLVKVGTLADATKALAAIRDGRRPPTC